jgi:hypothetical protein
MKDITLDDIQQEQFDSALLTITDILQSKFPQVDLRRGTVLHDLLLNPNSILYAWFSAQQEELRKSTSLKHLEEESITNGLDVEDANIVLSNFGITMNPGTRSTGKVCINVSIDKEYRLYKDTKFSTLDGIEFRLTKNIIAARGDNATAETNTPILETNNTLYFIVDVECVNTGSNDIQADTVLSISTPTYGIVSCYTSGDFSNGSDGETLSHVINTIPSRLSARGMFNSFSIEAALTEQFKDSNNPISYVSVCGYGNPIQKRDQHNVFGVSTGGRVDVYVRNFSELPTTTLLKVGTRNTSEDPYKILLDPGTVSGLYAIKSIYIPNSGAINIGAFPFSVEYTALDSKDIPHDIQVTDDDTSEVAGTSWRGAEITVFVDNNVIGDEDKKSEQFVVEIVRLPNIDEIQNFLDQDNIRNCASDIIVRCPFICTVSVNLSVLVPLGTAFDVNQVKEAIKKYVNTSGFNTTLYQSEIVSILHTLGVVGVDLNSNNGLYGYVYDARGHLHELQGDRLDISRLNASNALLSPDSVVFCTQDSNININVNYINSNIK